MYQSFSRGLQREILQTQPYANMSKISHFLRAHGFSGRQNSNNCTRKSITGFNLTLYWHSGQFLMITTLYNHISDFHVRIGDIPMLGTKHNARGLRCIILDLTLCQEHTVVQWDHLELISGTHSYVHISICMPLRSSKPPNCSVCTY